MGAHQPLTATHSKGQQANHQVEKFAFFHQIRQITLQTFNVVQSCRFGFILLVQASTQQMRRIAGEGQDCGHLTPLRLRQACGNPKSSA